MTGAPDISAEAVEHTAVQADEVWADLLYLMGRASLEGHEVGQSLGVATRQKLAQTAATLRALRAALDAAERQNRMLHAEMKSECADAFTTGYARGQADGIRKAAALFRRHGYATDHPLMKHILALLPANTPPPQPDALAMLKRVVAWAEQSGAALDANWWHEAQAMIGETKDGA